MVNYRVLIVLMFVLLLYFLLKIVKGIGRILGMLTKESSSQILLPPLSMKRAEWKRKFIKNNEKIRCCELLHLCNLLCGGRGTNRTNGPVLKLEFTTCLQRPHALKNNRIW